MRFWPQTCTSHSPDLMVCVCCSFYLGPAVSGYVSHLLCTAIMAVKLKIAGIGCVSARNTFRCGTTAFSSLMKIPMMLCISGSTCGRCVCGLTLRLAVECYLDISAYNDHQLADASAEVQIWRMGVHSCISVQSQQWLQAMAYTRPINEVTPTALMLMLLIPLQIWRMEVHSCISVQSQQWLQLMPSRHCQARRLMIMPKHHRTPQHNPLLLMRLLDAQFLFLKGEDQTHAVASAYVGRTCRNECNLDLHAPGMLAHAVVRLQLIEKTLMRCLISTGIGQLCADCAVLASCWEAHSCFCCAGLDASFTSLYEQMSGDNQCPGRTVYSHVKVSSISDSFRIWHQRVCDRSAGTAAPADAAANVT